MRGTASTSALRSDDWPRRRAAEPAALAAAVGATAAYGAWRIGPTLSYDGEAHLTYARAVAEGRLPGPAETYEYASPPAFHALAAALHSLTGSWTAAQGISAIAAAGLVILAWLLARELWPGRHGLWLATAALTAGMPIVPRLGAMFHPEAPFAVLAVAATYLVVRASRREWPLKYAGAAGALLGVAALTRQTAAAVMLALALGIALGGGRGAVRFLAIGLAAIAVTAGPWWGYQTARFGNPLESNLDRYILEGGQPRAFYVSAPLRDLVVHPYRPAFAGELWPQFHADLWSDWFGGQHAYWGYEPGAATRVAVSAQSVLGLVFAPIALVGVVLLRHRPALVALVAVSWAGFVTQLIRFPQAGGDPIKSSYMLYLAPVFALAAVEAGRRLPKPLLATWGVLYALSYVLFVATSWP